MYYCFYAVLKLVSHSFVWKDIKILRLTLIQYQVAFLYMYALFREMEQ